MSLALYLLTALALLGLTHRFITPLTKRDAILLTLLPMLFTGRALLTGGVYAPVDLPYLTEPLRDMREALGVPRPHNGILSDLYAQMIPWRKAVQVALAHGEWPLWNPFILSGTVLAAAAQPAAYSPFTLLACLLPVADSLTFSVAITFFIAALGAYLFARELGCRETVALIAAAGWMYSQPIAFFALWSIGASWSFFPLVLLGTRRCVRSPGVRSTALLAVALTLLVLAGHPETAAHAVCVGVVYGLFEFIPRAARDHRNHRAEGTDGAVVPLTPRFARRKLLKPIAAALAAGAIALLLCAIYILPILEAAPQTMEHAFRAGGWREMPHGVPNAEAKARVLADVFPFLHGHRWTRKGTPFMPLDTAAAGSIVLAVAVYAMIRVRSRDSWFFAALAVFGIAARSGWLPLSNAMQKLPLFDLTLNERFSFAAAFALALLAALGVEHAVRTADRRFGWMLAAAAAIFAGGAVLVERMEVIYETLPEWGVYAYFADVAGLCAAAIAAVLWPRALAPLLLVVLLVQRLAGAGDIYPTVPRRAAYPPIPILEPLRGIHEPFRVTGRAHAFIPGTSALYELEDVRGYEAMTLQRYFNTYPAWCIHQPVWFNRVDDLSRPFLDLLNVRFAIASDRLEPPPWWREVARQRGAKLLENTRVLPRAFLPEQVVLGATEIDALNELPNAADFRQRAWIEAPIEKHERDNRVGAVTRVRRHGNGLRFQADMALDGWVVVSEPAWKGWRLYLDGKRVKHYPANATLLGVFVPKGRHDVRVTYLPEAFVTGRTITFVTIGALIVTMVVIRLRRGV
jgi:Bacterial membrane protein YfhO